MQQPICRNFKSGSCRYGDRCKFLHPNTQQQQSNNGNGFGFGSHNQQKQNPFGFGVQQQQGQPKPFDNKWSRFSTTSTTPANTAAPQSRQAESKSQVPEHKCTDPESCKRVIVEDLERERPIWNLTCYSHVKNGVCDIVGDISSEELRAAAYDDAKRGLSLQSIIERERNLLNSKLIEFTNLRNNPYKVPQNTIVAIQTSTPTASSAFSPAVHSIAPSVSGSGQFGAPLNTGFGKRQPSPSNNAFTFGKTGFFSNSSQTSSPFSGNNFQVATPGSIGSNLPVQAFDSSLNPNVSGFANPSSISVFPVQNPTQLTMSGGPHSASNAFPRSTLNSPSVNVLPPSKFSGDPGIWLKEKWEFGEIPEEAPPQEFIFPVN